MHLVSLEKLAEIPLKLTRMHDAPQVLLEQNSASVNVCVCVCGRAMNSDGFLTRLACMDDRCHTKSSETGELLRCSFIVHNAMTINAQLKIAFGVS